MSSDDISIRELVSAALLRWKLAIVCGVSGMLAAGILAFTMTPMYESRAVIAPVQAEDGGASGLSRIAGQLGSIGGMFSNLGLGGEGWRKEMWLATLRSKALLVEFVQQQRPLPELFPKRWDAREKKWLVVDGRTRAPTMGDALLRLKNVVQVDEDKKTGMVIVTVSSRDPVLAARWANAIVALANDAARERIIDESQRSISYLEAELQKTNVVERQQIIYRLIESRTSDIMMAQGRPEYAFAVVDRAIASDPDKYKSPHEFLMVVLGGMVGALIFACIVVYRVVTTRSESRGSVDVV